jgi:NAD(P) transhydrogenase
VHTGTIPSKTLRETALNLTGWRERGFYGRAYRVKEEISVADLRRRLLITLDHEVEVLEHQFARNRVQHIRGKASFLTPETLQVVKDDGEILHVGGKSILLAVGRHQALSTRKHSLRRQDDPRQRRTSRYR